MGIRVKDLGELAMSGSTGDISSIVETKVETTIEAKLKAELLPEVLMIENESHMHGGSATESHYNITAVSSCFDSLVPVKRHQQVYKILQDELAAGVHALALHLYTSAEWKQRQQELPGSPNCLGGSES